jgi:hypothetical protein
MAITNSTGWMITPPAIAMMRSTTPRMRSMQAAYPARVGHQTISEIPEGERVADLPAAAPAIASRSAIVNARAWLQVTAKICARQALAGAEESRDPPGGRVGHPATGRPGTVGVPHQILDVRFGG